MGHGASIRLWHTAVPKGLRPSQCTLSPIPFSTSRVEFETHHQRLLFMHITRAAAMLLCIVTEIQAYFRFDGARINERIHEVWQALKPAFEVKDLYDQRYGQLGTRE